MVVNKGAWITAGVVFAASVILGSMISSNMKKANPYTDKGLLSRGSSLPPIWLFYNTGVVNGRSWADFGARSSRVLNVPYLNLTYEAIVRHNSAQYRVEVINGISGLAELLGWDQIPVSMHTVERAMTQREMNWIRAAVLARFGGLWLEPSSICLRGFGALPTDKVVFFGTDLDEQVAGAAGTRVPGMRAVWSPHADHEVFVKWAEDEFSRISGARGGHLESDEKWDYVAFAEKNPGVIVNVGGECGRNGVRRVELDDIFGTSDDGRMPFPVTTNAIYVPVPWRELTLRRSLEWFLRMSEEQIMESDLVVRWLLSDASGVDDEE
jgi:hypothetical protein